MEKFKLITPTIEYKELAIDYIREHEEYNSAINGVGGLPRFLDDYEGWLKKLDDDRNRITNEDKVPAETYFLVRENDNRIVGMINIRLELNEKLRKSNGHIGFGIRPTERQKGYNKINLYLGLIECQKRNMDQVMLDCDKENLGSVKTIKALSGKLEKEYYDSNLEEMVQVYWINVNESIQENSFKFKQNISENLTHKR